MVAVAYLYSLYLQALVAITVAVLKELPCLTSFLLFQMPHAAAKRTSKSAFWCHSLNRRSKSQKSFGSQVVLGSLTPRIVQTSMARPHPQKTCPGVSVASHWSHSTSTCTWRSLRRVLVGRIFLLARHAKLRSLHGHLRFQMVLQMPAIAVLFELCPLSSLS